MKTHKTWREKLEKEQEREIVDDPKGRGKMLIPRPLDVDALMRQVEEGKLVTVDQIRERLAKRHGATIGCPITTGIFANVAAHVAEEDAAEGKKDITPYWRTLKVGGVLNEKYPGGVEAQAARLKEEGHIIEARGKKVWVKNFEKALVEV